MTDLKIPPTVYSFDDLARLSGKTYAAVYRYFRRGELKPLFYLGSRACFDEEAVKWVMERKPQKRGPKAQTN